MYRGIPRKMQVKIIKSFFSDIKNGNVYDVLDKNGLWIVTDIGVEYNLKGSYNEENHVVHYEIIE